ncbi:MAG: hypothetical protein ACLUIS_10280 [Longibaculum sp.]
MNNESKAIIKMKFEQYDSKSFIIINKKGIENRKKLNISYLIGTLFVGCQQS